MKRTFLLLGIAAALAAGMSDGFSQEKGGTSRAELKADPAAGKLLAEARAARALWEKFPGFTAKIEVNLEGNISRGKARVDAKGRVTLEGLDKQAHDWARPTLGSTVDHRLSAGTAPELACAFGPGPADDPLGREVIVLGDDKFHSSYRIRDRQLRVVARQMQDQKFIITVLRNLKNSKGQYLPASYVVTYWNARTGELVKTVSNHQSWRRVGGFDLPVSTLAVTDARLGNGGQGQVARSMTLSGHKLLVRSAK
jgi:hypothetical protein